MNILDKEEVFLFIEKCFENSNIAFIFNFLKNDDLTKVQIKDIFDYCGSLTKEIRIEENYLDNDVSIFLKK